jgi:integrase
MLMLTGCRRNEILTLRWEHVDLEHNELRLRDSKTGPRAVPLSPTVRQVLTASPRQIDNPWVFPGREPGTRIASLNASWLLVRKEAGLEDVRIHDLRHSFASRALALGESLPMIGKLLGHRQVQTTARYAHLARQSVKAAARRIEDSLAADIDTPPETSPTV